MPRKAQKGNPKKRVVTFRPPEKLLAYLEDAERRNFDLTASLLDLAEPMMELRQALGLEWHDLLKASEAAGEAVGITLARLVRAGLKRK
jgi:hypothetical protein